MLLEKIQAIEKQFAAFLTTAGACGREPSDHLVPLGWREIDARLGGGLADSGLHEWFGLEPGPADQKAPQPRRGTWTPPLCILVHLAWRALDRSTTPRWAVWIGRRCFPYPRALVRHQARDARLLDRSVFVAPRDAAARLWAIDLALRSPATAVVVADGSTFNMAATRRLHLAARREHKWILLIRPPHEQTQLSAAHSRWLVRWPGAREGPPGATADDALAGPPEGAGPADETGNAGLAPMNPRWSVELLRCKGVQPESVRPVWTLEWKRGQGIVDLPAPVARPAGDAPAAASVRKSAGRRSA